MTAGTHPQAMTPRAVLREARALLDEHGYEHVPVRINNRMTKTYGRVTRTRSDNRVTLLEMSGPLCRANDRWRTMETIRHEVAHVLADAPGHGPSWRAACAVVGIEPRRCYDNSDTAAVGRWVGLCANCETVVGTKTRRPKGTSYHHNGRTCGCRRGTPVRFIDRHTITDREQESIMASAKHYRYVVTDPVGIEHTDTRARKGDAVKAAQRTAEKEGGVRWVVYTPGGDVAEEWGEAATPPPPPDDDEPMADVVPIRKAAPPAEDKAYRRDRIPAGATEHTCTTCGRTLPVTKFPTTRDKSRLTECRACRDEKRAAAKN